MLKKNPIKGKCECAYNDITVLWKMYLILCYFIILHSSQFSNEFVTAALRRTNGVVKKKKEIWKNECSYAEMLSWLDFFMISLSAILQHLPSKYSKCLLSEVLFLFSRGDIQIKNYWRKLYLFYYDYDFNVT